MLMGWVGRWVRRSISSDRVQRGSSRGVSNGNITCALSPLAHKDTNTDTISGCNPLPASGATILPVGPYVCIHGGNCGGVFAHCLSWEHPWKPPTDRSMHDQCKTAWGAEFRTLGPVATGGGKQPTFRTVRPLCADSGGVPTMVTWGDMCGGVRAETAQCTPQLPEICTGCQRNLQLLTPAPSPSVPNHSKTFTTVFLNHADFPKSELTEMEICN